MSVEPRDLVFVGDVHLEAGDPHRAAFLAFLEGLAERASRVVLMGDVFDLWLGRPELEGDHHRAVIERLTALRARGVAVRLVEGNREYRVGRCHAGRAFDDDTPDGLDERFGGRRIRAVHGDLANPEDLQYRRWRRISRSAPLWTLFNGLPRRSRAALAARLERRLRTTNADFRREFPLEQVRAYGESFLRQGYDTVVLGHFHTEREIAPGPGAPPGRIFVLPEWRSSRRHLRVNARGEIAFVDSLA